MGELKRLTRMVQRQQLKTQIRLLKSIISTHEPLVKAMQITQRAFVEGKKAGAQEMAAQIEAAEQEKLLAEALKSPAAVTPGATYVPSDACGSVPTASFDTPDNVLQSAVEEYEYKNPKQGEDVITEAAYVLAKPPVQSSVPQAVQVPVANT